MSVLWDPSGHTLTTAAEQWAHFWISCHYPWAWLVASVTEVRPLTLTSLI